MSLIASLSLRARLALAMVGLAIFAVGIATLVSDRGLNPRLTAAAKARIQRSTAQLARIAADGYVHHGGWTQSDAENLERLADSTGLSMVIVTKDGQTLSLKPATKVQGRPWLAVEPVVANGTRVGTIRVSTSGSRLLSAEDIGLRRSLDSLYILAAAISVVAALFVAFLLAHTLTTPLRRARFAAENIAQGDLEVRVPPAGGAELRALGEALNRLAETLQSEEKLRNASVDDLAHELRTPVGGLLSRIEAAQDHVLPDEAANLDAMHAEAMRLTRLLDDLSRLADAERPGMLVVKRPVNIAVCARQQSDALEQQFDDREITLECDLRSGWAMADPDRIGQICANLLANALRYTPPGGHVEIKTATEAGAVLLDVSDNGVGISSTDVPHIFKRFWRADKSRSRSTGGAGIGLTIVKQLVDAHDGSIDVESTPGVGSRFRITLPAIPPPVEPSDTVARSDTRDAGLRA